MKVKVLFVHNSIPEYRVQFWNYLSNLADTTIVSTNKGKEDRIYHLKKDIGKLNIKYWNKDLKQYLNNYINKWDIVILPPVENINDFQIAWYLNRLCRSKKVPFIYWTEKWILPNSRPVKKIIKDYLKTQLIKIVSKNARLFIASGSKSAEYLNKNVKVPKSKIQVVYDSSTSPIIQNKLNIRKKYKIPKSSKIILYLGRLIPRKGCVLLIKSIQSILKPNGWYLIIGGTGDEESLKSIYSKNSHIIFVGKVQPNIRRKFYEQSNVFVLPSYAKNGIIEAWGLTINEALECGLPVVTTKAVGAAYDLIDEDNGIVVEDNNTLELKKAIETILNEKRYQNKIKISKKYQAKYSVKQMAKNFFDVISLLLSVKDNENEN